MDIDVIVEEFKNNDHSHFNEFYQLTHRQVYFTALSILKDHSLSEDILQDTYLTFLKNIFDFKNGGNVYSYISMIARNLSINMYHRQKYVTQNDDYLNQQAMDDCHTNQDLDKILNLLDHENEREIVVYHVILNYKFQEIAKIMNKPLGTILWIYNKALKKLKERIGKIL